MSKWKGPKPSFEDERKPQEQYDNRPSQVRYNDRPSGYSDRPSRDDRSSGYSDRPPRDRPSGYSDRPPRDDRSSRYSDRPPRYNNRGGRYNDRPKENWEEYQKRQLEEQRRQQEEIQKQLQKEEAQRQQKLKNKQQQEAKRQKEFQEMARKRNEEYERLQQRGVLDKLREEKVVSQSRIQFPDTDYEALSGTELRQALFRDLTEVKSKLQYQATANSRLNQKILKEIHGGDLHRLKELERKLFGREEFAALYNIRASPVVTPEEYAKSLNLPDIESSSEDED